MSEIIIALYLYLYMVRERNRMDAWLASMQPPSKSDPCLFSKKATEYDC